MAATTASWKISDQSSASESGRYDVRHYQVKTVPVRSVHLYDKVDEGFVPQRILDAPWMGNPGKG